MTIETPKQIKKFEDLMESLRNCKNVKSVTPVKAFNWAPTGHAISYIFEKKIGSLFLKGESSENIKNILKELEGSGATNIRCYYTQEIDWRNDG